MCICRTRPSLNMFCPWSCDDERGMHLKRTPLTYPSSFCQAGTRTTSGDPWLCKLKRNKHGLPVSTPSPNTHTQVFSFSNRLNITGPQRTKTIFFLTVPVPVDPTQYYWPLLHVSRFLYCLNKTSQARQNLLSNIRISSCEYFKMPQGSHCRGTPFLAISIG